VRRGIFLFSLFFGGGGSDGLNNCDLLVSVLCLHVSCAEDLQYNSRARLQYVYPYLLLLSVMFFRFSVSCV